MEKAQENFRWITPILVTMNLFILGYLAREVATHKEYVDRAVKTHSERPHIQSATKEEFLDYKLKVERLTENISELTSEVKLLRQALAFDYDNVHKRK